MVDGVRNTSYGNTPEPDNKDSEDSKSMASVREHTSVLPNEEANGPKGHDKIGQGQQVEETSQLTKSEEHEYKYKTGNVANELSQQHSNEKDAPTDITQNEEKSANDSVSMKSEGSEAGEETRIGDASAAQFSNENTESRLPSQEERIDSSQQQNQTTTGAPAGSVVTHDPAGAPVNAADLSVAMSGDAHSMAPGFSGQPMPGSMPPGSMMGGFMSGGAMAPAGTMMIIGPASSMGFGPAASGLGSMSMSMTGMMPAGSMGSMGSMNSGMGSMGPMMAMGSSSNFMGTSSDAHVGGSIFYSSSGSGSTASMMNSAFSSMSMGSSGMNAGMGMGSGNGYMYATSTITSSYSSYTSGSGNSGSGVSTGYYSPYSGSSSSTSGSGTSGSGYYSTGYTTTTTSTYTYTSTSTSTSTYTSTSTSTYTYTYTPPSYTSPLIITTTSSAVNNTPTIASLSGDSLSYSEGAGAVVIEQGGNAAVTDVDSSDFNTGTLTVSFAAGSDPVEDVLAIRNQGSSAGQIGISGSNVTYGGATIGTFTGGSSGSNLVITLNSNANATATNALIKNITYQNTDTNNPTTGNRTVRFVLTDGDGATSSNYDTTVSVSSVNDAPTIASLTNDARNYIENTGAVIIEQGGNAAVTDVDSNNFDTGTLTVSFVTGSDPVEDVLAIRNEGSSAGQIGISGSNVTYGGTTIGTFTGGSSGNALVITLNSSANAAAATALIKNITYENTNANPSTSNRTVRFVLTDGDGATSSNYDTTVSVSSVNDAHTIASLTNDACNYIENTGAVIIEQGGNAAVTDVDSNNFDTGTLTVSFVTGSDPVEDVLAIRNAGSSAGQIGISGSNVTYGGTTIGTFTGGSSGNALVITLNSSANAAAATPLIKNITYENSNADPSTSNRTVRFVLTDGDGATSSNYDTLVTVNSTNNAPTIANLTNDACNYIENTGAVIIDQSTGAVVTDIDNANFNNGTLTVSVAAGGTAGEDVLAVKNVGAGAGQIGVSGSDITYAGTTIGTFTGGTSGNNLVITLNSSANATATSALVKNITYQNTSDNPSTVDRTVRFVLTDGSGGTTSNYDTTISISASNDAPTLSELISSVTLAENTLNSAAQIVDSNVTFADVDSANLNGGTLTVSYSSVGGAEDQLTVQNQGTGAGQISVSGSTISYENNAIATISTNGANGASLVITFNTANATVAATKALIQAVMYQNTSDNPAAARTLSFTVTDANGGATSTAQTVVVNVTPEADAKTLTSSTDSFTTGAEADTFTTSNANFAAADIISAGAGSDTLSFTNAATITAAKLDNKTGIDIITFASDGNSITFTDAFVGASDSQNVRIDNGTKTITTFDTSAVTTGGYTVTIGGTGAVTMVNASTGYAAAGVNTSWILSSSTDKIYGNTGNDTFTSTSAKFAQADVLQGGTGSDKIAFSDAATVASTGWDNKTGIDVITIAANGNSFTFSDAFVDASDSDNVTINGNFTITTFDTSALNSARHVTVGGTSAVTLVGASTGYAAAATNTSWVLNSSTTAVYGNSGNDTFTTTDANLSADDVLSGGTGTDKLVLSDAATITGAELAN